MLCSRLELKHNFGTTTSCKITINYLQNNVIRIYLIQTEPWENTMNTWIWLTLATSPIAFLISFHFTYRWALFDSGRGSKLYWKMLRTDLHCSIPGRHGDIARITRCRGWIKNYAQMGSDVSVRGIQEPFKKIWKEKRYPEYERYFMFPKWWIWRKMALCLIWPISLPLWFTANVLILIWVLIMRP